ncbi:hypothetical protein CBS147343_350 [Aspergillus niger]|uniref:Uncharacterized protein n=2 Tax=Aspergillus TaxID=5052 RepID=A0A370PPT8_ASPPH|nr:uncharacterized protein BO96DRAFT_408001 [Aspergillus niger CBS 101883]KAI2818490.1 hypothetical protein CBS133816_10327 [Aspergillus niger]RDK44198.1 hypothetical protein M752DRAFT_274572 [Aspergillus phoenicis ATCC 13157]KAI2839973.1 hypothetical protein CBS11350_7311 [Aspergillus niger]KAI2852520.1 hypothetical protein CBS12448_8225 [Aspergillus niger]KAI2921179.1 hypothetical protein CBS147320_7742 [Aspergillus niger]
MTTPLSSLTPSRQNSRAFSPSYGKPAFAVEEDDMDAPEDPLSSPFKVSTEVQEEDPIPEHEFYESHDDQGMDNEDVESVMPAPSSPFQFNAREETVDFQRLRALNRQVSPGGFGDHSMTPRKRSYEQVPDDTDGDVTPNDRYKKGTGPRSTPDINVYADEDAGFIADHNLVEDAGQEVVNSMVEKNNEGMSTVLHEDDKDSAQEMDGNLDLQEADDAMTDDSNESMDETRLSTFSAIPDMTTFAQLRNDSPYKTSRPHLSDAELASPSPARKSPRRSILNNMGSSLASPLPRKRESRSIHDTPNLLDLTDQPNIYPRQRYSVQNERYSPSRRSPLRTARDSVRSPAKASLLDFDIPSVPTPRSIPTVTPRELETLKSGFLSEISSLKATLSGKEAEVASLKQAVADAERRVGEALEEVRNEVARKETLEFEQAEWERRGQEMEAILREVRAEIVEGEQEKERLARKLDEAEKSREQLEGRVVELESQLASALQSASAGNAAPENTSRTKTSEETAKEVQDAVEKVARELHTLYKSKHETKVAALKKSYEARWEKRVREAENKLTAANEENERLKIERDAAVSEPPRVDPSLLSHEREEHEAEKRVLEAQIKGLQQEMTALKEDNERLHAELKQERAEKGELVAAVDEWLAIQQDQPPAQGDPQPLTTRELESPEPVLVAPEPPTGSFQRSVSHGSTSSGIRPPSTTSSNGEKRIPKIGAMGNRHARGNSGSKSGIAVPTPGRSGIMGSIERMGRGGA